MKKTIFLIFTLILVGIVVRVPISERLRPSEKNIKTDILGVANPFVASFEINFDKKRYLVNYLKVDNAAKLELIGNFTQKLTSSQVFENNNCSFVSSAGFYSKNNEPIGYFKNENGTMSEWQQNILFNGVLSINDFDTPRITRAVPQDNLRLGLQSGPLLIENAKKLDLLLEFDEEARRVIAVVSGKNELIFMAIRTIDSGYSGPFLKDLPKILTLIEAKTDQVFADAINLDGASASAFITQDVRLPEAVMSGSFFCLKK